jgi:hypothetical protein
MPQKARAIKTGSLKSQSNGASLHEKSMSVFLKIYSGQLAASEGAHRQEGCCETRVGAGPAKFSPTKT